MIAGCSSWAQPCKCDCLRGGFRDPLIRTWLIVSQVSSDLRGKLLELNAAAVQ